MTRRAGPTLAEARSIANESQVGPESELGLALARVEFQLSSQAESNLYYLFLISGSRLQVAGLVPEPMRLTLYA